MWTGPPLDDVGPNWQQPPIVDLIATLARKDFFVRYRRASLGVLWAVGLPLIQAVVLAEVFSHFRVIRAGLGVSMPVYVFTGITVYSFFTGTVTGSTSRRTPSTCCRYQSG